MDVCSRHGPFDVVIDDGGHTGGLIWASLRAIFPGRRCMRSTGSVCVIEDACTMASKEFVQHPLDIAGIAAQAWWSMHHHWLTAPELSQCSFPKRTRRCGSKMTQSGRRGTQSSRTVSPRCTHTMASFSSGADIPSRRHASSVAHRESRTDLPMAHGSIGSTCVCQASA